MRTALCLLLLAGCVSYRRISLSSDYEQRLPPAASMNGKYRELLLTLEAPEDVERYGPHHDYGWWELDSYRGYGPLPAGYWVYVEPVWYVWEREARQTSSPSIR